MADQEQRLSGGRSWSGVVRIGDTVRRPLHIRSEFVQALLRDFEAIGSTGRRASSASMIKDGRR
jgi:hypothetical protein